MLKWLYKSVAGPDAPKLFMPMKIPFSPIYLLHPISEAASIAIRGQFLILDFYILHFVYQIIPSKEVSTVALTPSLYIISEASIAISISDPVAIRVISLSFDILFRIYPPHDTKFLLVFSDL